MALSAASASADEAEVLDCEVGEALFVNERMMRNARRRAITSVRLVYAPGYRMSVEP